MQVVQGAGSSHRLQHRVDRRHGIGAGRGSGAGHALQCPVKALALCRGELLGGLPALLGDGFCSASAVTARFCSAIASQYWAHRRHLASVPFLPVLGRVHGAALTRRRGPMDEYPLALQHERPTTCSSHHHTIGRIEEHRQIALKVAELKWKSSMLFF